MSYSYGAFGKASTKVTTYTRNSYTYNGENVDLIPGVPDLQYLRASYCTPQDRRAKMSHFIFGSFVAQNINKDKIHIIKNNFCKRNVCISFNYEISYYPDILKMLKNNFSDSDSTFFGLTTTLQITNSDDLIFPYDKYSSIELFPRDNDRSYFNDLCRVNLVDLEKCIVEIIEIFQINKLYIFVSEGYSDEFVINECSVADLISDLYNQVCCSFSIIPKEYILEQPNIKQSS